MLGPFVSLHGSTVVVASHSMEGTTSPRPRADCEKVQVSTRSSTSFMISDILDTAPRTSRESSSEDSERYSLRCGREDSPSDQGSEAGGDVVDSLENECEKLDEHG